MAWAEARRGCVVLADDKGLDAAVAAAARLGDGDVREQQLQLRVQQRDVLAPEYLGLQTSGDPVSSGPGVGRPAEPLGEFPRRKGWATCTSHVRQHVLGVLCCRNRDD